MPAIGSVGGSLLRFDKDEYADLFEVSEVGLEAIEAVSLPACDDALLLG